MSRPSMQIEFGPQNLHDYETASRREWLVTNGIGGYAAGSLAGSNTRRYHGLLVAAIAPPAGRVVTLAKLEETAVIDGGVFPLSANQYPGAIHPQGFRSLASFTRFPVPSFLYHPLRGVRIEKSIWMAHGKNTTYIKYTLHRSPGRVRLELRPLIAWTDYHTEFHRRDDFPCSLSWHEPELRMTPYSGLSPLRLTVEGARFMSKADWYYNIEHLRELERGLDCREDLYSPGHFDVELDAGESVTVVASVEPSAESGEKTLAAALARQERLIGLAGAADAFGKHLVLAADQFIVQAPNVRSTVIAGYPWFTDWGRDTMISLPGLCLAAGRPELAREILAAFADFVSDGMLPNRFPDGGTHPEYNTADATLWYVQAIYAYLDATKDEEFVEQTLMPVLEEIIAWHLKGTRYRIKVDADGLLSAGEHGVQLTWMDAKVGDYVVTPRTGKPVEINALWHNALRIMALLARRFGKEAVSYQRMAKRARASFAAKFERPDGQGLFDVIDGAGGRDESIRPNQIFAVSLPFSPLDDAGAKRVVDTVQRHLLTPVGLRTLSPEDPAYKGRYGGDPFQRDAAYHQGTVWPWLLGPFVEAHLRVYGSRAAARRFLKPMQAHLADAGVGSISEIFSGDPPFSPDGCIAQAWSVAEVLRLWKQLVP
ncbi:MAG: amylo-alpha-1,6-glucosidase [Nitrospirota bacterium]